MKQSQIQLEGKTLDLPIMEGSEGERAIDISKLRAETRFITYDSGFGNTGSCTSGITFVDGEKGILRHRGFAIEDLCEHASFLEVAYLLIYGELPGKGRLEEFTGEVTHHTMLHEDLRRIYDAFPRDAHPMATLSSVVCCLSTFYQDALDPQNTDHVALSLVRLLAKLPTIAAFSYKKSIGQPLVYPRNDLSYAANFLHMMFALPSEPYQVEPQVARVLEQLLILHADHEQNCSTSAVRVVGSSRANLFASISAGICALWGPLHGGANQAVVEMLEQIHSQGGDAARFMSQVKDRASGVRLMGFGHRVYKNFDPRAKIIKVSVQKTLQLLKVRDPLLEIAFKLEELALKDDYFVERKLYPNVDFYSGILYRALGFPLNMFTVLFALGRLPGWIAQWKEMMAAGERIARPRQIYTGPKLRKWVPLQQRG